MTFAREPQVQAVRAVCRSPAQRRERRRRAAPRAQRPCRRLARRLPPLPLPPPGHSRPHRRRPPSSTCFARAIVTRWARARAPASGPRTLEPRSLVMGPLASGRPLRPSTPRLLARRRSRGTSRPRASLQSRSAARGSQRAGARGRGQMRGMRRAVRAGVRVAAPWDWRPTEPRRRLRGLQGPREQLRAAVGGARRQRTASRRRGRLKPRRLRWTGEGCRSPRPCNRHFAQAPDRLSGAKSAHAPPSASPAHYRNGPHC